MSVLVFPASGSGATPAIGSGATSVIAIPALMAARESRSRLFLSFVVVVAQRCGQVADLSMDWGQVGDLSQDPVGRRWGGAAAQRQALHGLSTGSGSPSPPYGSGFVSLVRELIL